MFLDIAGEGFGHASYPFFTENDKQYLSTPRSNMVLSIMLEAPGQLECFVNCKMLNSREIASGEQKLPLADLIPLEPSEVYFQITTNGAAPVKSTVYVFIDNWLTAETHHTQRQYKLQQAREERRRLARLCPPPSPPATYQDLIDQQLRLGRELAKQAAVKLAQAANLASQAAGTEIEQDQLMKDLLDGTIRSSQEAGRLVEEARNHLNYAEYYSEEKLTQKTGTSKPEASWLNYSHS